MHSQAIIPIGVIVGLLWAFVAFMIGMLSRRLDRIEQKLDEFAKNCVSVDRCEENREVICKKIGEVRQVAFHHKHSENGKIIVE